MGVLVRNGKLIDWLDEITADCPKKSAHNGAIHLWVANIDRTTA